MRCLQSGQNKQQAMYRYAVDNAVTYTSEDLVLFRESPFACWMERLTLENPDHGIPPDLHSEPPGNSIEGTLSAGERADESRLTLSTIHSAKGLEWHTVFIIWALDGRFPAMRSQHKEDEIEEELRLMYVAATRAEDNLYFICPGQAYDRATGMILNRPSRFLEDLQEDALDIRYNY